MPADNPLKNSPKQKAPQLDFPITSEIEAAVGISLDQLVALYTLDEVKGFGPQKFKLLHEAKCAPGDAIKDISSIPLSGKRGDDVKAQIQSMSDETKNSIRARAEKQVRLAFHHGARILTYASSEYPVNVYRSNNPIAVLYVRGGISVLGTDKIVACVGSRGTASPYSEALRWFTEVAVSNQVAIVSGFALGADIMGHEQAVASGGQTICVLPNGLDRPFPPENRAAWDRFMKEPEVLFVSEFPFGRGADSTTLRKRNKLIVAFARGVLVAQSAIGGGAMNAFRAAREQHKPVATFVGNSSPETSGNEHIAETRLGGDAVFPITRDDSSYERWLHGLFCST